MLPYVIIHNAVSVDGRMDRLDVDLELYYSLISIWKEDLTLTGAETMLQPAWDSWEHDATTDPSRPLVAVVDSRGRFRKWSRIVPSPYWRAGVALCSEATPREHIDYLNRSGVDTIITPGQKVDLRRALEGLVEGYGVKVVRVDSGGTLNGALLRAGLIDEVSVLIQPLLIGGESPSSLARTTDLPLDEVPTRLELMSSRELKEGKVWLRYKVLK
jgi:2,5-diamino-6-(ribosylamino)-4(3H)-pyrimidinone 5'-phosphate reductase